MNPEQEQNLLIQALKSQNEPLEDVEEEAIRQFIDLQNCEHWYKAGPNNYRLLELWDKYCKYGVNLPDWLQKKVDAYLVARLRNERSRYSTGNQKRSLQHIIEIASAEHLAATKGRNTTAARNHAIKKIAEREGVTPQAIRTRIRPKKKK